MINDKPYSTRLLVTKMEVPPVTTSGGALLGSGEVALGERALVVEAGKQCTDCKIGTIITYPIGVGKEIYLNGVRYLTLLEQEIYFYDNSYIKVAVDKTL